ncbi:MAG: hypothetical protein ACLUD2_19705 [Clostridium sp.]
MGSSDKVRNKGGTAELDSPFMQKTCMRAFLLELYLHRRNTFCETAMEKKIFSNTRRKEMISERTGKELQPFCH